MANETKLIKLLLVDDEHDFRRATARVLTRRGFVVQEAESGERALECLRESLPEVVVLDLKMAGMGGISTLSELRKIAPTLPVIILTGHGRAEDAFAGIRLEIVDFLQKPVDVDRLAAMIRALLSGSRRTALREKTLRELCLPPTCCPRVYEDETLAEVLRAMRSPSGGEVPGGDGGPGLGTVLVFDRGDVFRGVIHRRRLLDLVLPSYLQLPQASYFTGMFLAELKTLGRPTAGELLAPSVVLDVSAPLMEALHLLVSKRLTSVPVLRGGELVGLLTERALVDEIAEAVIGDAAASRQRGI